MVNYGVAQQAQQEAAQEDSSLEGQHKKSRVHTMPTIQIFDFTSKYSFC
jgi:hypothetical protein